MTPEQWRQVTQVFHTALRREASERDAFLDDACRGDAALRQEVLALLAAHEAAGQFGTTPLPAIAAPDSDVSAAASAFAVAPPRTDSFIWVVAFTATAVLAVFGYGAWVVTSSGGRLPSVGWTETRHFERTFVTAVGAQGPAGKILAPGDQIVALDGLRPIAGMGTRYHRRRLRAGDSYDLTFIRDGQVRTERLQVTASAAELLVRLPWFVISAIWCAVGLFIGFARPGAPVARLAFASAVATGIFDFQVGFNHGGIIGQPLHAVLAYHFFIRFPTGLPPHGIWKLSLYSFYALGALAAAIGMSHHAAFLMSGAEGAVRLVENHPLRFGVLGPAAFISWFGAVVSTFAVVRYNYRHVVDPDQRRRVRWVMYGGLVAVVPTIAWMLTVVLARPLGLSPPMHWELAFAGWSVAFPLCAAYAIVRHRVFEVRVIVRRGVQYVLARRALQALGAVPAVALLYTVLSSRDRTIGQLATESTTYLYWIGAIGLTLFFRPSIRLWLDRRFFREELSREQMLGLVDDLARVDSIASLSNLVCDKIGSGLHPTRVLLWYRDPRDSELASSSNAPIARDFPAAGPWLAWLEQHGTVAQLPLPAAAGIQASQSRWLVVRGIEILIPIVDSTDRLSGVMMLGCKKSEEPYSAADRRLLVAIATQAGVARENLRLRAEVVREQRIRNEVLAHLGGGIVDILKECPECGRCFDGDAVRCDRDAQELRIPLPVSRTIEGKYRLDRLLGRGGMGAVYEACDLRLNRPVAVKLLVGRSFGEASTRRFQREARAAAQLNHPHIVSVFDYGMIEGGGAYIVMECVAGRTLRAELDRNGRLTPTIAAAWFDPLLDGLAAAHARGIVHRDLKPENIIGREDQPGGIAIKILDFGLAKVRDDAAASDTMTAAGVVMGTLGYMSPEQLLGRVVDDRTDVFAVGVMIAEALTGRRPFDSALASETSRAVLHDDYHLPVRTAAAQALDRLLQRCLAKTAPERPAAGDLRRDLIPLLRECPPL